MSEQRLIDANELIAHYEQTISDYAENGLYPTGFGIQNAINWTVDMPTVDAAPVVHGHWTRERCFVVCSQCGTRFRDCKGAKSIMTYKFCPICGAKMDEEVKR